MRVGDWERPHKWNSLGHLNLNLALVTNHFKDVFQRRGEDGIKDIEPTEMKRPFTEVEIRKSVGRWKNNKTTGIDDISAEMIKYSPKIVYQQIEDIFNEMATPQMKL